MAKKTLKKITEMMRDLDPCMMTTITKNGMAASRPMSNNSDVKFDGTSYFFTWAKSQLAKDIAKNSHVNLSFTGAKKFKKLFVSVSGKAKLIKDKTLMREHWTKDLEIWFDKGVDTPGIVMIEVDAKKAKYWHGGDEGELSL